VLVKLEETLAAIAKKTSTSLDIVKELYEEEAATLSARATIEQFVSVIATRRLKQHLRVLGQTPQ
jgi:Protein of unknown function (DUF3562)